MPICGNCPYCNEPHLILLPDELEESEGESIKVQLPIFQKAESDCCNKTIWIKYSIIDPEVLSEEEFYDRYSVNEETKEIKIKP